MSKEHPLLKFLGETVKPWRFADQHKIPRTSLYALLRGENQNPSANLMQDIETATQGVVTVQMQSDWSRQFRKGRKQRAKASG